MNIFERWNENIRNTEGSFVNLLSAIAPWGAPLAPAYMAYHAMTDKLGFDPTIAGIMAAVIEILGLATVSTTLQFWQHNRRYSTQYKRQPVMLAGGMFLFYLLVILTVNVILELPNQNQYTPIIARALLSLLSVPAAITMAARTQYAELRREIAGKRDEQKKARHVAAKENESFAQVSSDWRKLPGEDRALIPTMTSAEVAERYGVSLRTAQNWKAKAPHSNGRSHD